jgi:hypothetical protein
MRPRRLFSESFAMGAQVIHTPICAAGCASDRRMGTP